MMVYVYHNDLLMERKYDIVDDQLTISFYVDRYNNVVGRPRGRTPHLPSRLGGRRFDVIMRVDGKAIITSPDNSEFFVCVSVG